MTIFELPPWKGTTVYQSAVDFCTRNNCEKEFEKMVGVHPKNFEETEFFKLTDAIEKVLDDREGLFTVREHDMDFNSVVVDEYKPNTVFRMNDDKVKHTFNTNKEAKEFTIGMIIGRRKAKS